MNQIPTSVHRIFFSSACVSILLALFLCAGKAVAVETGQEGTYTTEMSKLMEATQKALEENRAKVQKFYQEAHKSLQSEDEVKQLVDGYLDNLKELIAIFEDDGELMKKARELRVEYDKRAKRTKERAGKEPDMASQYKEMSDQYDGLVSQIVDLEKSLRVARTNGKKSMAEIAKKEMFLIEKFRHSQAVSAVNALKDVTFAFEQSMKNCTDIVKSISDKISDNPHIR